MRVLSLQALAAYVFSVSVVVACGSGDSSNGPGFGETSDGGVNSSSSSGGSSGSSSGGFSSSSSGGSSGGSSGSSGGSSGSSSGGSEGGTGTCGQCTTDSDCQNNCPPVQGGGVNCCDVGSGVCYATIQMTCPAPSDGGTD